MVLDNFFNIIFGWTIKIGPLFGIIFISFLITLLSTLAYKYFTDQNALKLLKEDHKRIQEEMKKHKDDAKKIAELNKEALQKSLEPFKHQIKPLLITFIPFILIFAWLRTAYVNTGDLFLGIGWFGNYILFSFVFSIALRKLLKVY